MKKILSIMLCTLFGMGYVWADATATVTLNVKAQHQFTPAATGVTVNSYICEPDGTDCNSTNSFKDYATKKDEKLEVEGIRELVTVLTKLLLGESSFSYTFKVRTEIVGSSDYVFSHWTDNDGNIIPDLGQEGVYTYKMARNDNVIFKVDYENRGTWRAPEYWAVYTNRNSSSSITLTAHWVQPQVTGTTVTNCGEVTNPHIAPTDGKITFALKNNTKSGDYQYDATNLLENNFAVKGAGAYSSPAVGSGSYTYTIGYTPENVHGTHSATMTLSSKYPSGTATNKSRTATISVNENYTPLFSTNDSYNFGEVSKGGYGQTPVGYLALVKNNYAAENATWIAWVEGTNADLFQIQGTKGVDGKYQTSGEPIIRFVPINSTADGDYTATLCLQAIYTDAAPKQVPSAIKQVTLNAKAYTSTTAKIQFGNPNKIDEVDFGTIIIGASATPKQITLLMDNVIEDASSPTFVWNPSSIFTYNYNSGSVTIGISSNPVCGDYSSTLTITANTYLSTIVTDNVTIKAKVRLATPILTALGGIGNIALSWQKVEGANYYTIYRDGSLIYTTANGAVTSYSDNVAANTTHTYVVTAVYSTNTTYNTSSSPVTASEGVPQMITVTNAGNTGFYTGTENGGDFPYRLKTPVVLTNTFDVDGKALFDTLYIFGLTTNTEFGHTLNKLGEPNNARTPCYVYGKNGNVYLYNRTFDATQKRFDWETKQVNKHIYFTGYCPFANIGTEASHEGWMYFRGGNNARVDIYLENCDIRGRYRTSDGSSSSAKYPINEVILYGASISDENKNYLAGYSSIFVFGSTATSYSAPFTPTIHIRGDNHLKGQQGYIHSLRVKGEGLLLGSLIDMPIDEIKNVPTMSSPITIKPDKNNYYTSLVLDDLWPTNHPTNKEVTHGYLILDTYLLEGAERAPSIDMGSEYGSVTFNGGKYRLRNNASKDGQYTCNMAVCYRKYSKSLAGVEGSLYGFGDDMTKAPVVINSGTFTMYKNMYGTMGAQYYIDGGFMDLRLPKGGTGVRASYINGGTFSSEIKNVLFCSKATSTGESPLQAQGLALALKEIVVTSKDAQGYATAIDLPETMYDGSDDACYDDSHPAQYNLSEDVDGYVVNGMRYGAQSLLTYASNGKDYVRLLLPSQYYGETPLKSKVFYNWATTIPLISIDVDVDASIGGPFEVWDNYNIGESNAECVVNYLMYTDMEGMQGVVYDGGDAPVTIADIENNTRGNFTNIRDFSITKQLHILKTVEADRWYAFTAPFNIDKVEVIEYGETEVKSQSTRKLAKEKQAAKNLQAWYIWNDFFLPKSADGRTTGHDFDFIFATGTIEKDKFALKHYNGTSSADGNYGTNLYNANYYLYELVDEEFSTDGTGETLDIKWVPVKRNVGEPLMYAGKTYAIQFPFCPMCNDLATREYYDYWTNKFIHFHGTGPQTIAGSNKHTTIISDNATSGTAKLVGNYTFADMTLPAGSGYVHNTSNDFFELNTSEQTIKPTQGYMLYNSGSAAMPERISRSGKMIYGDNTTTDVEGVPTIGERTSLMLYDAMDGFEVLSAIEQVVTVYNLQGNVIFHQLMAEGEQVYVAAAQGIYVVKGEREAIKVMVD